MSISPLTGFGNATTAPQPSQPPQQPQTPAKQITEYPLSYDQYKTNSIITNSVGAAILGLASAAVTYLITNASDFADKAKSSKWPWVVGIGVGVGAVSAAASLFKGFNGGYEAKYLTKKKKFESLQAKEAA